MAPQRPPKACPKRPKGCPKVTQRCPQSPPKATIESKNDAQGPQRRPKGPQSAPKMAKSGPFLPMLVHLGHFFTSWEVISSLRVLTSWKTLSALLVPLFTYLLLGALRHNSIQSTPPFGRPFLHHLSPFSHIYSAAPYDTITFREFTLCSLFGQRSPRDGAKQRPKTSKNDPKGFQRVPKGHHFGPCWP